MSYFYKISIDLVNANYISGWCFKHFSNWVPVTLECWLGEDVEGY
jgi:hypothetical protein